MEALYQEKDNNYKKLTKLKNKYLAIIYKGVLEKKTVKQIHQDLYNATINKAVISKDLLNYAIKLSNKSKKLDNNEERAVVAGNILPLLLDSKAKKIINLDLRNMESKQKTAIIKEFINENRAEGRWYYLASSHNDCAKDHKPYQGKIYVDEKAPEKYKQGYKTIQWVLDSPAYFVTRPNCRHFFVSIENNDTKSNPQYLKQKYQTHSNEGDRSFSTPAKEAVKEYQEKLAVLKTLYAQYPTEKIKRMIDKTELLLKKWKKII